MKHDWIAAAIHIAIVIIVYAIYAAYPAYQVPIPYFDSLAYLLGTGYGIAGILVLHDYVRTYATKPAQSKFNMAVLLIVVGGLLFMAETIGNAR